MVIIHNPKLFIPQPQFALPNSGGHSLTTENWGTTGATLGTTRTFSVDPTIAYSGSESLKISAGSGGLSISALAYPVSPGSYYRVRVAYRTDAIWSSGLFIRLLGRQTFPRGGFVTQSTSTDSDFTDLISVKSDAPITVSNTWLVDSFIYSPLANINWASFSIYNWINAPVSANLWFELLEFSEIPASEVGQSTLTKNISAIATGNTSILTPHPRRTFETSDISIRVASIAGTLTAAPFVSVGSNAPNYDNIMANTQLVNSATANRSYIFPIVGSTPVLAGDSQSTLGAIITSGQPIFFRVNTAATGVTALTYDVLISGRVT